MDLNDVVSLLEHPAPAFWCENITDRSDQNNYLVPVRHAFQGPTEPDQLKQLCAKMSATPGAEQLIEFYRLHDGAQLFTNPRTGKASIELVPFGNWDHHLEQVLEWLEMESDFDDEDDSDDSVEALPYTVTKMLPVGQLCWAPDMWLMATDGDLAGHVFFWGHDGEPLADDSFAPDYFSFVARLFQEVPGCFGGIIRFSAEDAVGETPPPESELYPIQYVSDYLAKKS